MHIDGSKHRARRFLSSTISTRWFFYPQLIAAWTSVGFDRSLLGFILSHGSNELIRRGCLFRYFVQQLRISCPGFSQTRPDMSIFEVVKPGAGEGNNGDLLLSRKPSTVKNSAKWTTCSFCTTPTIRHIFQKKRPYNHNGQTEWIHFEN